MKTIWLHICRSVTLSNSAAVAGEEVGEEVIGSRDGARCSNQVQQKRLVAFIPRAAENYFFPPLVSSDFNDIALFSRCCALQNEETHYRTVVFYLRTFSKYSLSTQGPFPLVFLHAGVLLAIFY